MDLRQVLALVTGAAADIGGTTADGSPPKAPTPRRGGRW